MTAATPPSLLSVRDLRVTFKTADEPAFEAVKGVSFDIPANRTVALVGESGSGKTVSAMSIVRLLPDNAQLAGAVLFEGQDLLQADSRTLRALRGAAISVVFQEPMSSLNPVLTVGDQIAEVLRLHGKAAAGSLMSRVVALLEEVGLPEPRQRIKSYPHELSGGQQQRVMIAMAIACEPKLLIADEPTTALDVTIQRQILDLLASLKARRAMSVLFITHDLGIVGEIADEVIVMQSGLVREAGPVGQIFEHPRDPYTRALIACRPRVNSRPRRLPVVAEFMGGAAPASGAPERPVRTDGEPILEVRHLSKSFRLRSGLFGHTELPAVRDVSFTLRRGRTLGLVGESGSGKTTVGMTLMRLHEGASGSAVLHGTQGSADLLKLSGRAMMPLRQRIQIVFQNPYASLNPRMTIGQILTEPMRIHGIGGTDRRARLRTALELLDRVGLPGEALNKYPHEFSGGQRQRIAIARCLTMRPEVLICDESVSALDVSVQAQVLNLLLDLQDEFGLSYLFISHDLAVVRYISDEVMVMRAGALVEIADSESIYRNPQDPYTRRLLASIPKGLDQALAA